jgi:hypothetical protein
VVGGLGQKIAGQALEREQTKLINAEIANAETKFLQADLDLRDQLDQEGFIGDAYIERYTEEINKTRDAILQEVQNDNARDFLLRALSNDMVQGIRQATNQARTRQNQYELSVRKASDEAFKNLAARSNPDELPKILDKARNQLTNFFRDRGKTDEEAEFAISQTLDEIRLSAFNRDLQENPRLARKALDQGIYGFENENLRTDLIRKSDIELDREQVDIARNAYADIRLNPLGAFQRTQRLKGILEESRYKGVLAYARDTEEAEKKRLEREAEEKISQTQIFETLMEIQEKGLTEERAKQLVESKVLRGREAFGILEQIGKKEEVEKALRRESRNEELRLIFRDMANQGLFTRDELKVAVASGAYRADSAHALLERSVNTNARNELAQEEVELEQVSFQAIKLLEDRLDAGVATEEEVDYFVDNRIKSIDWGIAKKHEIRRKQAQLATDIGEALEISAIQASGGPYDSKDKLHQQAAELELQYNLVTARQSQDELNPESLRREIISVSNKYGFVPETGLMVLRQGNSVDPIATAKENQQLANQQYFQIKQSAFLYSGLSPIIRSGINNSDISNIFPLHNKMQMSYKLNPDGTDNFQDLYLEYHMTKQTPEFAKDARIPFSNSDDFTIIVRDEMDKFLEFNGWFDSRDIETDAPEVLSQAVEVAQGHYRNNLTWTGQDAAIRALEDVFSFAGDTQTGTEGRRVEMFSPEIVLSHLYNRDITTEEINQQVEQDILESLPELVGKPYLLRSDINISDIRLQQFPFTDPIAPRWMLFIDINDDGVFKPIDQWAPE